MPYTDLIQQFCNHLSTQKRYSANTVESYLNDLRNLESFLVREYEQQDLTGVSVQILKSWLSSLRDAGLEARSVNRKLSAAKSFYKYLLRQQLISVSPASGISSMKIKKKLPVFVEEKQMKPVLERSFFPQGFEGDTHFLIFLLFYQTGMRVSELALLGEQDVQFSSGIISVHGKGNKQRNIPLSPDAAMVVEAYIAFKRKHFDQPSDTLLVDKKNKALSRTAIYRIVKNTLGEVTTLQKKSPHVLRHSFATHMSDHGASIGAIKELLGHSSLAATQVYTHTSIARLKEIHKKNHPKS